MDLKHKEANSSSSCLFQYTLLGFYRFPFHVHSVPLKSSFIV